MTLAPFHQFMSAINRHIERKHETPDYIPSDTEIGRKLGIMVPNYAKPGVRERVEREIMEAEWAANPPRSSVELLQRFDEIRRFEQSLKKGER